MRFFFLQSHWRISTHLLSIKGKCHLHVPNVVFWDFRICCPEHQKLSWTGLSTANNSYRAVCPLNWSSNRPNGLNCLITMFLVTVGFLITVLLYFRVTIFTPTAFMYSTSRMQGGQLCHSLHSLKEWCSPVFTEAKQVAVIKVNTWNDWF